MAAHAKQLRKTVQEYTADPGSHVVMRGRGAVVNVDGEDRDDDGERDEDHGEDKILANKWDDLRRGNSKCKGIHANKPTWRPTWRDDITAISNNYEKLGR